MACVGQPARVVSTWQLRAQRNPGLDQLYKWTQFTTGYQPDQIQKPDLLDSWGMLIFPTWQDSLLTFGSSLWARRLGIQDGHAGPVLVLVE